MGTNEKQDSKKEVGDGGKECNHIGQATEGWVNSKRLSIAQLKQKVTKYIVFGCKGVRGHMIL